MPTHDQPVPTASEATRRTIDERAASLPMHDTPDFDDAERGLVARADDRQVRAADGRVVWDLDAYSFLDEPTPDTVNPMLKCGDILPAAVEAAR